MTERERLGMQVQSLGRLGECSLVGGAVERVAKDGSSESLVMGTVHAQLVRAPCLRGKQHAQIAFGGGFQYAVMGFGPFAVVVVNDLARTV